MVDPQEQTAQVLAAKMRVVLEQTRWDPCGEPGMALDALARLDEGIAALVTLDNELVVLGDPVLGGIYVHSVAIRKTINQQHPAQPPDRRTMSPAQFIEAIRPALPSLHQQQHELLTALDQAYPPRDDRGAAPDPGPPPEIG
ncbi:hypothetical protein [Micromonospora echinaurantiaca]|uniref:hypothetical protein n=1 Tax=Micromonospora echinaurantiaca TaxID=47857 RepID=UPI003789E3AA